MPNIYSQENQGLTSMKNAFFFPSCFSARPFSSPIQIWSHAPSLFCSEPRWRTLKCFLNKNTPPFSKSGQETIDLVSFINSFFFSTNPPFSFSFLDWSCRCSKVWDSKSWNWIGRILFSLKFSSVSEICLMVFHWLKMLL